MKSFNSSCNLKRISMFFGSLILLVFTGCLRISPSYYQFPDYEIGTPTLSKVFVVKNVGSSTMGNIQIAKPGLPFVLIGNTCPRALRPAQSCEFEVMFKPEQAGTYTDTLWINYYYYKSYQVRNYYRRRAYKVTVGSYLKGKAIDPPPTWKFLPDPDGQHLADAFTKTLEMTIAKDNTHYIGYVDSSWQNEVIKFNGSTWESLGSFDERRTIISTVTTDSQNNPYVAYNASSDSALGIVVKRYINGSWEALESDTAIEGPGISTDLAFTIGPDDTPYLAFVYTERSNRALVLKYDSSIGLWNPINPSGGDGAYASDGGAKDLKMASSSNGVVVAFQDMEIPGQGITVKRYTDSGWETLGQRGCAPIPQARLTSNAFDLTLDSRGQPYLAFADPNNGNKLSVMKFNGVDWNYVGQRDVSDGSTIVQNGFSFFGLIYIHVDLEDNLYVGYRQGGSAIGDGRVKRFNTANGQSSWEYFGEPIVHAPGDSDPLYLMNFSMALSPGGIPCVSYSTMYDSVNSEFHLAEQCFMP